MLCQVILEIELMLKWEMKELENKPEIVRWTIACQNPWKGLTKLVGCKKCLLSRTERYNARSQGLNKPAWKNPQIKPETVFIFVSSNEGRVTFFFANKVRIKRKQYFQLKSWHYYCIFIHTFNVQIYSNHHRFTR